MLESTLPVVWLRAYKSRSHMWKRQVDRVGVSESGPSENHNRFMDAYAAIENLLRTEANVERGVPFKTVITRQAAVNRVVRQFQSDLLQFHELRNVMVHERRDNSPIAFPLDGTVEMIDRIAGLLRSPVRVDAVMIKRPVSCTPSDRLSKMAQVMKDRDISQVPVVEEGCVIGLLTASTIARWYGAQHAADGLVDDAAVRDVLQHTENRDHVGFIARTKTAGELIALFEAAFELGNALEAIVVTEGGEAGQKPLGIVTNWDLPGIYKRMAL